MTRHAIAHLGQDAIAYTVRGDGPPVLLCHGAALADFMVPLAEHPALASHTVINYHRLGYGFSSRVHRSILAGDAAWQAAALLTHLGVESAHVVGHSFGGLVATALATAQPDRVRSLALLEPLHLQVPSAAELAVHVVAAARAAYDAGEHRTAVDLFLTGVAAPYWRRVVYERLGGQAFGFAVADAPTLFDIEMPAGFAWDWDNVPALVPPLLLMLGGESWRISDVYPQGYQDLLVRFPHAAGHVVPDATHLLHVENPNDVTARLVEHFASTP